VASIIRRALYALATSDTLEALVRRSTWLEQRAHGAARRYVAGRSLADALATVERLRAGGFATSLDLFGESVTDTEVIERVVQDYLEAAAAVAAFGADVYLEVVPSHLGIDVSPELFRRQTERIIEALPAGSRLEVSAEESWRTDRILAAVLSLAKDGAPVMSTLQANLRRSAHDADRLGAAGVPVRLVKGAYVEPPAVAHSWGEATDVAYVRLAHQLQQAGGEVAIGTHDPVLREALLLALPGLQVEMLLGVRPADAQELVRRGHHVRIYVPYGEAWFRYWLRRLAEARGA
jgi:proline dehydrogenase